MKDDNVLVCTISSFYGNLTKKQNERRGLIFTKFQLDMKVMIWKWINWAHRWRVLKVYSLLSGFYGLVKCSWSNYYLKQSFPFQFCNLLNWIFCFKASINRSKSLKEKRRGDLITVDSMAEERNKGRSLTILSHTKGHLLGCTSSSLFQQQDPPWVSNSLV